MKHLYWCWEHPERAHLEKVASGLAVCSTSHHRDHLTLVVEEVTCPICQENHARRHQEEQGMTTIEAPEVIVSGVDLTTMTNPQLTAAYNVLAGRTGVVMPVKKFKNLEIARARVAKIMAQVPDADEVLMKASSEPVKKEATTEARPRLKVKKEKEKKVSSRQAIDPDAAITIINEENTSRGETKRRWDSLVRSTSKTVGNYVSRIGTIGDLKWWRDKGKIKIS